MMMTCQEQNFEGHYKATAEGTKFVDHLISIHDLKCIYLLHLMFVIMIANSKVIQNDPQIDPQLMIHGHSSDLTAVTAVVAS